MPTVKTVFPPRREPHFRDSRVFQKQHIFYDVLELGIKRVPGVTFGGLFEIWTDLGGFLESPWAPIQTSGCSSSCSKSLQQAYVFLVCMVNLVGNY